MVCTDLYYAGLIVCILRQAAQGKGGHLLQLHIARAQHVYQRRHCSPLHYFGLEVGLCRGKLPQQQC